MTTKVLTRCAPKTETRYRTARVNIVEDDAAYVLEAEMPGVPQDGFDIKLDDRRLTVVGTRPVPEDVEQEAAHPQGYRRVFTLGDGIDRERIEAVSDHGILRITLHKSPDRVPRRIAVT